MSNTNNNMQTQTSNTLHNAIMEAGSKDRPPMLAPGNYVQWKSRIKRYIDTKPNHELIHYCLENPPYELGWKDKEVPTSEGSLVTRTERVNETYKNVSVNQLKILKPICIGNLENSHLRMVKHWNRITQEWQRFVTLVKQSQELKTVSYYKLYDILKQHQHEVNEIRAEKIAHVANSLALVAQQQPVYHPQTHPTHYTQNSSTRSQQAATRNKGNATDKEINKLMNLISLSFKKIYKPTNNNLRTSSNTSRANQDNSLRINRNDGYENQRIGNVAGAKETVGSSVVQKSGIQCYNCKEFRHVARKCQKPKRTKDIAYHREKMLLYQELEAHYMYMAQLQEVSPDAADSGPIFDDEPLQKDREEIDQNDDDNDLAKEQLARRNSKEYASQMELECAKVRGIVEDKIRVPKLPKNCARCAKSGYPVNGLYCQGCTHLREKLEEDLVTYFQNFQNTSESSDDSTNVVNTPREPLIVKKDHGVNPPHIDECCCECGNALDGIFCQQCTCKSCGKGTHIGYNCPPKVPIISNPEPCNQTMNNELPQTLPSFDTTCYSDKENLQEEKRIEEEQAAKARYWKIPACCDDDDDYNPAITPILSIEEPVNSLSMRDEHLNTILATESDEVIKSSIENLVPIPSESQ
nr:hypothetical protein [Tanacetum cinerariifolium]